MCYPIKYILYRLIITCVPQIVALIVKYIDLQNCGGFFDFVPWLRSWYFKNKLGPDHEITVSQCVFPRYFTVGSYG